MYYFVPNVYNDGGSCQVGSVPLCSVKTHNTQLTIHVQTCNAPKQIPAHLGDGPPLLLIHGIH